MTLTVPLSIDANKFWARVDQSEDCWTWTKFRDKRGYGRVMVKTEKGWRPMLAHRASWFLTYGTSPPELDHLCRNTSCVRPDHLEAVPHVLNSQRALVREICQRGHNEWYVQPDGRKRCRVCVREYEKHYVRKNPERVRALANERQKRYQARKKATDG